MAQITKIHTDFLEITMYSIFALKYLQFLHVSDSSKIFAIFEVNLSKNTHVTNTKRTCTKTTVTSMKSGTSIKMVLNANLLKPITSSIAIKDHLYCIHACKCAVHFEPDPDRSVGVRYSEA